MNAYALQLPSWIPVELIFGFSNISPVSTDWHDHQGMMV
ncbi:hypothetical protein C4J89_1157 [Pseudomonas sp. R4-35-07]|nr:hypothetical protein C4J89_1157 [Pseudomonas sp. R4-35-07]